MIVRRRGFEIDENGDPTGVADSLVLEGCNVAPRRTEDIAGRGRSGTIEGLTLYGPFDIDIRSSDVIEVDGTAYTIDGDVGRWQNRRSGRRAGVEVALKRGVG